MKMFTAKFPWFNFRIATSLALLLVATSLRAEDDRTHFRASPLGSKVRIDGSSNIHDWAMEGALVAGTFDLPKGIVLDSTQGPINGIHSDTIDAHAEVSIPVNSVQSGTDGMDAVMQQAMNMEQHPRIVYHLTELTFKGPHTPNTPFAFDSKGELVVNGVTNKITMPVTIESAAKNKLKINGSVALKMTDFKITPPVKAGIFVTVDAIKITFEWIVAPHTPAPAK